MIKKKIILDFLPINLMFVLLESIDEDYDGLAQDMRNEYVNGKVFSGKGNNILILIDMGKWNFDIDVLPHEVEHSIDMIEKYIDQDFCHLSEYRAYLTGYINNKIMSTMLDCGYSINKIKNKYVWSKINTTDNQEDININKK